jgi:hypothetical protein
VVHYANSILSIGSLGFIFKNARELPLKNQFLHLQLANLKPAHSHQHTRKMDRSLAMFRTNIQRWSSLRLPINRHIVYSFGIDSPVLWKPMVIPA